MESNIILDISRYQQRVDFSLLKNKGQDYIIAKCASGSMNIDAKWESHHAGAREAKMKVIPYFWVDPIYDAIKQAKFFINAIEGKDIEWIELDFEQWWSSWESWNTWMRGTVTKDKVPVVSAENLFKHFKAICEYVEANTKYKVVVYTAAWFINSYCPQAWDYLANKYTHWASYFSYPTLTSKKTWNELQELAPVGQYIPTLPKNYPMDKVVLWQWSGDKFKAEGVYANTYNNTLSSLDLNLWVSSDIEIEDFNGTTTDSSSEIEEESPNTETNSPTISVDIWRVTATKGLKIRQNSNTSSVQIGSLKYGEEFKVSEEKDGWGKLYGREGYTYLYYATKIGSELITKTEIETSKYYVSTLYGLNIRSYPTTDSNRIGFLQYREEFYITSIDNNGWGKLYNRDGYVCLKYARQIN